MDSSLELNRAKTSERCQELQKFVMGLQLKCFDADRDMLSKINAALDSFQQSLSMISSKLALARNLK